MSLYENVLKGVIEKKVFLIVCLIYGLAFMATFFSITFVTFDFESHGFSSLFIGIDAATLWLSFVIASYFVPRTFRNIHIKLIFLVSLLLMIVSFLLFPFLNVPVGFLCCLDFFGCKQCLPSQWSKSSHCFYSG
jgi:predicted MFS family arabinose efflux permease